jgi:transcriptional regulator with XRE-family HTH domain
MKPFFGQHLEFIFLHLRCNMLSSDQIRGARAILRLSQADLAKAASLSLETIKRLEAMRGELKVRLETLMRIKEALERAGVEFIPENGGGAGVRLAKRGKRSK